MIDVVLNWTEVWLASEVGKLRQFESLRKGLPDKHGFEGGGFEIHIQGSAGEMAVAKALGIYWGGSVNTFKSEADVGSYEIRTRSRSDYDLLVRPDDKDDSIFIHVTGQAPNFQVHGWLKGSDAKKPEFSQTHGNRAAAYFVPAKFLQPIESLKR